MHYVQCMLGIFTQKGLKSSGKEISCSYLGWNHVRRSQSPNSALTHWIVEAISLPYSSKGLMPPAGLCAHSTKEMPASWALFKGVTLQDICEAASWSLPHTFARFYILDVTAQMLAHAVLRKHNFVCLLRNVPWLVHREDDVSSFQDGGCLHVKVMQNISQFFIIQKTLWGCS